MIPWFVTELGAGCTHPAGPRCRQGDLSQMDRSGTIPGTAVLHGLGSAGSVTQIRISSSLAECSGKNFEEETKVLWLREHVDKKLGDLFLPLLASKTPAFQWGEFLKCGNC